MSWQWVAIVLGVWIPLCINLSVVRIVEYKERKYIREQEGYKPYDHGNPSI